MLCLCLQVIRGPMAVVELCDRMVSLLVLLLTPERRKITILHGNIGEWHWRVSHPDPDQSPCLVPSPNPLLAPLLLWLTSCQPCSLIPISSVQSLTILSRCGLQEDCRKPLGMGETEPRCPWFAQKVTWLLLLWVLAGLGWDYSVPVVLC